MKAKEFFESLQPGDECIFVNGLKIIKEETFIQGFHIDEDKFNITVYQFSNQLNLAYRPNSPDYDKWILHNLSHTIRLKNKEKIKIWKQMVDT